MAMENNTGIPWYGDAPCRGCNDRHASCHTSCKNYLDYKEYVSLCRQKIRTGKANKQMMDDYYKKKWRGWSAEK